MYRIGECPKCGGTQYLEPDTREWACMTCGYRPVAPPLVFHEAHEMIGRGKARANIEVLGIGVQSHRCGPLRIDTHTRSHYYDANRAEMEEQYDRVHAMRSKARHLPALRQASVALAVFHKEYGLDSVRWSRLRTRWQRQAVMVR